MEPLHLRPSISPEIHGPRRRQGSAEKQCSLSSFGRAFIAFHTIRAPANSLLMGVYWFHDILRLVFFEVFAIKSSPKGREFRDVTLDFYMAYHCIHSGFPGARPYNL
jgi:hypothetical protein